MPDKIFDFESAKRVFSRYISAYDLTDDKIRLKVRHTFGVVSCSEYLADALGLDDGDRELARLIALLHDIGRFEQLRRFRSFDDRLMPHAQCSLDVLFEQGMIREFLPQTRELDGIIYTAIKNHGVFLPEPIEDERTKLHSLLIRDADKLDNFYVKETEPIETMLDVSAETAGKENVSKPIFQCVMQCRPVKNSDRVTHLDMWVSYLAYIYDLNFDESCRYVLEKGFIPRIIGRISYQNPETAGQMRQIKEAAEKYLKERLS